MNILIPDSWLREYLRTDAIPAQIKEYLSLCGPSVERVHEERGEAVYDIEVTSNRPDSMSVAGIAREAAAILPRFGVDAHFINDPYGIDTKSFVKRHAHAGKKKLQITTNSELNPRWTSIVIDNVTVKASPKWLQRKLELTGIRALNNVIDITNYLMRSFGQPAHAFDYDRIKPNRAGIPTMRLRASRKGEKLTTLDGKTHLLPGGDIVIEDGEGRLIDLCGIMGAENSSISESTKTVVLFMQTYNPANIRRTSMTLAHRTEAAQLFEKGLDSELVLPTVVKGIELMEELTGGKMASQLYDIYPHPYRPRSAELARQKLTSYLGTSLSDQEIGTILSSLGLKYQLKQDKITVTVPSFRQDVEIDVDIIEEIARIYGYHHITPTLPETAPPVASPDPQSVWEEEIKVRLRDWGFAEVYSYSMISKAELDAFAYDAARAYKISNPLSSEWTYMRPGIWPSVLKVVQQNLNHRSEFKLFELGMRYRFRQSDLPSEEPVLLAVWTGERFLEAKGVAQVLLDLFGIPLPKSDIGRPFDWYDHRQLNLGRFGSLGVVQSQLLVKVDIKSPLTLLELEFAELVTHARPGKSYTPVPKYPPVKEDLSFNLPLMTSIGEVLDTIKSVSPRIDAVSLTDQFRQTFTVSINYLDRSAPLSDNDVRGLREAVISAVERKFHGKLKA